MSWISNILGIFNVNGNNGANEKTVTEKTEQENGIFVQTIDSETNYGDKFEIQNTVQTNTNVNSDNISSFIKEAVNKSGPALKELESFISKTGKIAGEKISDISSKAFNFIGDTVSEIPFIVMNKELQAKNKETVSDSKLSNTYEYNGLTNQDMLLLSSIAYTDIASVSNKGKTLGEVVEELKNSLAHSGNSKVFDEDGNITADGIKELRRNGFNFRTVDDDAFSKMFNEILNDENLYTLTILDSANQNDGYVSASTYGHLDENGMLKENATVVYMGTGSATGWEDNAYSLYQPDTKMQKAAYDYLLRQQDVLSEYSSNPDEVHVSVTGHSKGGNLAMYSTIKSSQDENLEDGTIIVDNCVSFNGQGFNDEFIEENQELIDNSKAKITAINTYFDSVSALLNPVAGTTWNVAAEITKSPMDENGNIHINNKDQLGGMFWDGHCHTAMYKAVSGNNGEDTWTVCNKSAMADAIASVCDAVENISDIENKKFLANVLAGVFIDIFCGGNKV